MQSNGKTFKAIDFFENSSYHNNIIELVKWGNDNDIINCSLASFIINNGWNDLQALKDGGLNINLDSVKMI